MRREDAIGINPSTGEALAGRYPISPLNELEAALDASVQIVDELSAASPKTIAAFLDSYASRMEGSASELAAVAHRETGLPESERLHDVEIPRTTAQLRATGAAARVESWRRLTRDADLGIVSHNAPLGGPVVVMGPNSFPFAFNSVAGGDFAAAIAAHNPVIAKANPGHLETTRMLAILAYDAAKELGLPGATVQLIFKTNRHDGLRLVSDARLGALAFTGSSPAGLALKAAADSAGTRATSKWPARTLFSYWLALWKRTPSVSHDNSWRPAQTAQANSAQNQV